MSESKLIGKEFLGKYKIIKLIGKGGMESEVYLAETIHSKSNNHFSNKFKYTAIKFIKKTSTTTSDHWNRILDEGVTNARLATSEYIVKLYEMHPLDKDTIVLIMEYIDGPSLKELIRNRGCLSIPETLSIFKKILHGVSDMHTKERVIIHRDLKPENIMLSKDLLDVKIADFGISSVLVQDNDIVKDVLTNETSFFGTIPYVTPDATSLQSFDNKKMPMLSKQYDFHALGIIFYEMLIGEKPFEIVDENDPSIILYWKKYDILPMKKINKNIRNEIENVFLKLTASRPNIMKYRYNDVSEIMNDIEEIESRISKKQEELPTILSYNQREYQQSLCLRLNSYSRNKFCKFIKSNKWLTINLFLFLLLVILLIIFISLGLLSWTEK
ncbi:serine/threonine-protein kinase [Malacoplasma muris]|uniref:serine/threonine-protein kinase n=1 Tax=Malacoplasma muris TaxID=2119 RepID=UPI00398EE40E